MSLTVQLAAALAISCVIAGVLCMSQPDPVPVVGVRRHRRRARPLLAAQLAVVVLVAAAVINPRLTPHPGA